MDMKLFALLVGYVQGVVSKISNTVKSVNGKTGEVNLTATDVGAATTARGLPTGGTVGDILKKTGTGNYACGWAMAWEAEQLTTDLYIYRQGNMRVLVANNCAIANPLYTLDANDRPTVLTAYPGMQGTSASNRTGGMFRVQEDGIIQFRSYNGTVVTSGNGWGIAVWSTNAPTVPTNGG